MAISEGPDQQVPENEPIQASSGRRPVSGSTQDSAPTNKEIAKILEDSLNFQPERVDVKIKLLEIYHHEALGNRESFHSLLSRLGADLEQLTPAQRQYVEMLQRTLADSKTDADADLVAAAAVS